MIEQVVNNTLSLIQKIVLQDTQALQLFTLINKTETIYKSN
jgi:hypothetical protein